jgi:hypothetical protein
VLLQIELGQADAIAVEGGRLDDVGPGFEVGAVNVLD